MECPYLSEGSDERVCNQMINQGLDGELDEFDIKHYCKGNPNHCYFYRTCEAQKTTNEQHVDSKPEKIQVVFYDELSKLKLGEAEIPVDSDNPLHFKLAKRGFRHKVKSELVGEWVLAVKRLK